MTDRTNGTCPLCKESFPLSEIHAHISVEQAEIRQYTVKMIQSRHPEWVEEDGACKRCWRFYGGLGRFVHFFRKLMPTAEAKARTK